MIHLGFSVGSQLDFIIVVPGNDLSSSNAGLAGGLSANKHWLASLTSRFAGMRSSRRLKDQYKLAVFCR